MISVMLVFQACSQWSNPTFRLGESSIWFVVCEDSGIVRLNKTRAFKIRIPWKQQQKLICDDINKCVIYVFV